jgi:hypothetical protein
MPCKSILFNSYISFCVYYVCKSFTSKKSKKTANTFPDAGHRLTAGAEVFVFAERRFNHERLDKHNSAMLQLQQGAEIRPCIEI